LDGRRDAFGLRLNSDRWANNCQRGFELDYQGFPPLHFFLNSKEKNIVGRGRLVIKLWVHHTNVQPTSCHGKSVGLDLHGRSTISFCCFTAQRCCGRARFPFSILTPATGFFYEAPSTLPPTARLVHDMPHGIVAPRTASLR
jgi:hypothetical protein